MRMAWVDLSLMVYLVAGGAPSVLAADDSPSVGAWASYESSMRPILAARCFGCHAGRSPKAGLDLSRIAGDERVTGAFRLWEKVSRRVAAGEMPPDGEEPLTDLQRRTMV